jgi:FAD/FMN-containing dehydrogenase
LRGGGGNFGVVTSFEFKLHPLEPEVLSGLVIHPIEDAGELLPEFRRIANEAPNELTIWAVMRKAPPLPFLPAEWHGKEVLIFAACYSGEIKEGEAAMKPLRALRKAIADAISPHPFTGWQAAFDPLLTPGARNYWKSHDFTDLPDPAIKLILNSARTLPSPECDVFIAHVGGAMARVAANENLFRMNQNIRPAGSRGKSSPERGRNDRACEWKHDVAARIGRDCRVAATLFAQAPPRRTFVARFLNAKDRQWGDVPRCRNEYAFDERADAQKIP